ncbi:unnamed protein product [Orchesella dallaii]|uniref:Uncharacterized protein n=1 Tax=Orchesella dallaii TaxID=48710 RepID=A0ABP1S913_9HEXA
MLILLVLSHSFLFASAELDPEVTKFIEIINPQSIYYAGDFQNKNLSYWYPNYFSFQHPVIISNATKRVFKGYTGNQKYLEVSFEALRRAKYKLRMEPRQLLLLFVDDLFGKSKSRWESAPISKWDVVFEVLEHQFVLIISSKRTMHDVFSRPNCYGSTWHYCEGFIDALAIAASVAFFKLASQDVSDYNPIQAICMYCSKDTYLKRITSMNEIRTRADLRRSWSNANSVGYNGLAAKMQFIPEHNDDASIISLVYPETHWKNFPWRVKYGDRKVREKHGLRTYTLLGLLQHRFNFTSKRDHHFTYQTLNFEMRSYVFGNVSFMSGFHLGTKIRGSYLLHYIPGSVDDFENQERLQCRGFFSRIRHFPLYNMQLYMFHDRWQWLPIVFSAVVSISYIINLTQQGCRGTAMLSSSKKWSTFLTEMLLTMLPILTSVSIFVLYSVYKNQMYLFAIAGPSNNLFEAVVIEDAGEKQNPALQIFRSHQPLTNVLQPIRFHIERGDWDVLFRAVINDSKVFQSENKFDLPKYIYSRQFKVLNTADNLAYISHVLERVSEGEWQSYVDKKFVHPSSLFFANQWLVTRSCFAKQLMQTISMLFNSGVYQRWGKLDVKSRRLIRWQSLIKSLGKTNLTQRMKLQILREKQLTIKRMVLHGDFNLQNNPNANQLLGENTLPMITRAIIFQGYLVCIGAALLTFICEIYEVVLSYFIATSFILLVAVRRGIDGYMLLRTSEANHPIKAVEQALEIIQPVGVHMVGNFLHGFVNDTTSSIQSCYPTTINSFIAHLLKKPGLTETIPVDPPYSLRKPCRHEINPLERNEVLILFLDHQNVLSKDNRWPKVISGILTNTTGYTHIILISILRPFEQVLGGNCEQTYQKLLICTGFVHNYLRKTSAKLFISDASANFGVVCAACFLTETKWISIQQPMSRESLNLGWKQFNTNFHGVAINSVADISLKYVQIPSKRCSTSYLPSLQGPYVATGYRAPCVINAITKMLNSSWKSDNWAPLGVSTLIDSFHVAQDLSLKMLVPLYWYPEDLPRLYIPSGLDPTIDQFSHILLVKDVSKPVTVFLEPFDVSTWLIILFASLMIVGILSFKKVGKRTSLFFVLSTLLEQDSKINITTICISFTSCVWLWSTFLIRNEYTSSIYSILTAGPSSNASTATLKEMFAMSIPIFHLFPSKIGFATGMYHKSPEGLERMFWPPSKTFPILPDEYFYSNSLTSVSKKSIGSLAVSLPMKSYLSQIITVTNRKRAQGEEYLGPEKHVTDADFECPSVYLLLNTEDTIGMLAQLVKLLSERGTRTRKVLRNKNEAKIPIPLRLHKIWSIRKIFFAEQVAEVISSLYESGLYSYWKQIDGVIRSKLRYGYLKKGIKEFASELKGPHRYGNGKGKLDKYDTVSIAEKKIVRDYDGSFRRIIYGRKFHEDGDQENESKSKEELFVVKLSALLPMFLVLIWMFPVALLAFLFELRHQFNEYSGHVMTYVFIAFVWLRITFKFYFARVVRITIYAKHLDRNYRGREQKYKTQM